MTVTGSRPSACSAELILLPVRLPTTAAAASALGAPTSVTFTSSPPPARRLAPGSSCALRVTCFSFRQQPPAQKHAMAAKERRNRSRTVSLKLASEYAARTCSTSKKASPAGPAVAVTTATPLDRIGIPDCASAVGPGELIVTAVLERREPMSVVTVTDEAVSAGG